MHICAHASVYVYIYIYIYLWLGYLAQDHRDAERDPSRAGPGPPGVNVPHLMVEGNIPEGGHEAEDRQAPLTQEGLTAHASGAGLAR